MIVSPPSRPGQALTPNERMPRWRRIGDHPPARSRATLRATLNGAGATVASSVTGCRGRWGGEGTSGWTRASHANERRLDATPARGEARISPWERVPRHGHDAAPGRLA